MKCSLRLGVCAILASLLIATQLSAHEIDANRATLVLREKTHLSLTLYLAYTDALYLALAPKMPVAKFLVVYSSMKSDDLRKELLRAQARFQSSTKLFASSVRGVPGKEVLLTNWIWPDAKQVQAAMQQRVMQAMVDPNGHSHESPMEIHAEANAGGEVVSAVVQFPDEFRRVMVVAYKPSQAWVETNTLSSEIKF